MSVKPEASEALRAAMRRLLNGNPLHTDGELTWANVWKEAGIPRATANRAKEVIAEWKKAVETRANDAKAVMTTGEKVRDLQQQLDERSRKNADTKRGLSNTINIMANHIQALFLALRRAEGEVKALRAQVSHLNSELAHAQGSSNVTSFPSGRK